LGLGFAFLIHLDIQKLHLGLCLLRNEIISARFFYKKNLVGFGPFFFFFCT